MGDDSWLFTVTDNSTGTRYDGRIGLDSSPLQRSKELFELLQNLALEGKFGREARRTAALQKLYEQAMRDAKNLNKTPPPAPQPLKPANTPSQESGPVVQDSSGALGAPDVKKGAEVDNGVVVDVGPNPLGFLRVDATDVRFGYGSNTGCTFLIPQPADAEELGDLTTKIKRNQRIVNGEPESSPHSDPFPRHSSVDADPVELFSGAFTISTVDLTVPTATGPIEFERCYGSGRPYYGPFGYSWDHKYNVYLRRLNDGRIALWSGRLHEQYFNPEGAAKWVCEPALAAKIEPLPAPADGFDVTLPGGVLWQFHRPIGWLSGERIPLVAINDRHGNAIHLRYDTSDRLSSVLDDRGRGLIFEYGNCGLLETVSDHTRSRVVRYQHHPEIEHLVRVVLPVTAKFPSGITTHYDYDMYANHPAMQHNILRVRDAHGRLYLENEYGSPDEGWTFNTIRRQRVGDYEYKFEYEQIQWVAPLDEFLDDIATRTMVERPDGSLHVYTFNFRGDLLDHRFRLTADGTYRVIATQRHHDRHGNVTSTTEPDGTRTVFTYDVANADPRAHRNLLRTEMIAALPGIQPSRTLMEAWYEPNYQLTSRTKDEVGHETRFVYDFDEGEPNAHGVLKRIDLPPSTLPDHTIQISRIQIEHNSRGQVTAILAPGGTRTELAYEPTGIHAGFLRRIVHDVSDAASTTEIAYSTTGFRQTLTEPGGATTDCVVNAFGQVEGTLLPDIDGVRPTVRRLFSETGATLRVERPRGNYNAPGFSDNSIVDEFVEDVLGRIVEVRWAANTARTQVTRTAYDYEGRPTSVWDAAGTRTNFLYDERGLLLSRTAAVGTPAQAVTRHTYDRAGRLARTVDAVGRRTCFKYDAWGRLNSIIRPSGAIEQFIWDVGDFLIERMVSYNPGPGQLPRQLIHETTEYDERGRRRAHTIFSFADDPATATGLSTHFTHDPDDQVIEVRHPRGGLTTMNYDGIGRITALTDVHENTTEYSYSPAGDLSELRQYDLDGAAIRTRIFRRFCDGRHRVRSFEGPDGRIEYDYDDRDTVTEQRATGGVTTRFVSGPHGETDETILDPSGLHIRSSNTFDARGELATYIDPTGEKTTWHRDELGRVVSTDMPDGSSWTQTLDAIGRNLTQNTPSGSEITFHYDDRFSQPVRVAATGTPAVKAIDACDFEYDALERMTRATNRVGTIVRRIDSLGRVIEESSLGKSVRSEYDDSAGTSELIFPDGRRERTEYDVGGRPTRVTLADVGTLPGTAGALLAGFTYAGVQRPTRIAHGNGVETTMDYDDAARMIRCDVTSNGTKIESVRTLHDERGRRALTQFVQSPTASVLHRFDRRDRLIQASWGFPLLPVNPSFTPQQQAALLPSVAAQAATASHDHVYELDDSDSRHRRIRSGLGGGIEDYTIGAGHRTISVAGTPVSYHVDGPRASDSRHTYDIDAFGRVVRVRDAITSSVIAEFDYDAISRVAAGRLNGVQFKRWFAAGRRIHEATGGDLVQWSPDPLRPLPICVGDSSGHSFIHSDGALTSTCTTDETGTIEERHRYSPFGEPHIYNGAGDLSLAEARRGSWWRGMPYVSGLKLYETPNRLYDPDIGVFLSRDANLYFDSPSSYVFATHNPVDFVDPSGLEKVRLDGISSQLQSNSSRSTELTNRRSSLLDRSIDEINEVNATTFETMRGGRAQRSVFDVEKWQADVGEAVKRHARARAISIGLRVARDEEQSRQREEAALQSELPGTLGSMAPIYGSARSMIVHGRHGNYVRATIFGALAISDVFLIKSLIVGGGKLLFRAGGSLQAPAFNGVRIAGQRTVAASEAESVRFLESVAQGLEVSVSETTAGTKIYWGTPKSVPVEVGSGVASTLHTHPISGVAQFSHGDVGQFFRGGYGSSTTHGVLGYKWPTANRVLVEHGLDPTLDVVRTQVAQAEVLTGPWSKFEF